jgi:hypothetical protein
MQSVTTAAAAIAVVLGVGGTTVAQDQAKAAEVLAAARQAIGGAKIESLTSMSVHAGVQRNIGNFQMTGDLELLVEMPDKFMRSESSTTSMASMTNTSGFNGDKPLKAAAIPGLLPGGGMVIRMGGPPPGMVAAGEKPTPEQQQQIDRQMVRSARFDISRLLLGWLGRTHPAVSVEYTYAGEAESPDGKAHVIDVRNADGFSARLVVDTKTHLPLMVTYQGPQPRIVTAGGPRQGAPDQAPGQQSRQPRADERNPPAADAERQMQDIQKAPPAMVEFSLFFDDWREEDGITFPHALRRAVAGITTEEWTIDKIKVNPRIDPKKFETEG